MPGRVREATANYRADEDLVAQFIADCCVVHHQARVSSASLFRAYLAWCEAMGLRPATQLSLARDLHTKGFEASRTKHERGWLGLGLRSDDDRRVTEVTR